MDKMIKCLLIITIFTIKIKITNCQEENNVTFPNPLLLSSNEEENQGSAKCVLKLTAKYFVDKKALSGSIVIININSYLSKTQKILLETIHSGTKYSVMIKDSAYHHKNASHFPEKAKNYMMILEDKDELLRNILQLNKLPTWNPHAKAVIYIEYNSKYELDSLVKYIINELRNYKLLKSIVLINFPDTKEVIAYTWKPYSVTNCGGPCDSVYVLDVCSGKTTRLVQKNSQAEVFPHNMNLCPLTVYTVVSEPYVMPPKNKINNSVYDDEYDFGLGIEINIMKMITQLTNMTLIIRMSNKSEDWGYLDTDGTSSGLFLKLRSEEVDIIIGNMEVNKIIRKWFDASNTYMQDEITWCVPKALKTSTWSNLITIFKISTWLTTLASLILISLMLHWFKYREKRNMTKWPTNSILMTFGMILGWGALFNPKSTAFRFLLFSWLLFSININTSYQSFLRSFLIHPKYERQIEEDSEIISAGYGIGGKESLKDYFNGLDRVSKYLYDNFMGCDSFRHCVKRVGFDRNFAIAAPKRQAIYQDQQLGKGASLIYCFQEGNIIYKYGVVVLARKWFPMLNRFNDIIRSVSENGLIWKWNNEVFLHQGSASDTNDMVPLGIEHMLGAFLFLILGYVTCFCVFVVENIIYYIRKCFLMKLNRRKRNKVILHVRPNLKTLDF